MDRALFALFVTLIASAPALAEYDFVEDWYETGNVGDGWGDAVCTVGDVNGDGYSDILVGAPDFGGSPYWSQGKVYLYLGGEDGPADTPIWEFTTNQAFQQIGYSIAPAGDMNDDGYADFVVGAPGYSNGHSSEGRLYFFLGGLPLPTWWTQAEINEEDARLGHSVSYAGDVNGDGYDDIVAGAPGWGGFGSPFYIPVQGRAYVYYGGANGPDGTADWNRAGGDEDGEFGWSVAGLGDVNGDGYSDIMIGKPEYDPGIIDTDHGQVVCYYGSANGPSNSPDWTQVGANAGDEFGRVVSYAGDFTGSGLTDALIGVPDYSGGAGAIYLASGGTGGLGAAVLWRSGYSSSWGGAASTMGDFNGDGRTDFVVGGGTDDNAYIYFGFPQSFDADDFINGTGQFADVVASAGDVNGDGLGDFMVVDPLDQLGAGSIRLYFGGREINDNPPTIVLRSGDLGDEMGGGLAGAGDVNADGFDDLLAGAPGVAGGGEVRVYYGDDNNIAGAPDWTASGSGPTGRFGEAVAPAGDVNGDGYADIVVGDPVLQEVHVFHGSAGGLSVSSDWSHSFPTAGAKFGTAVCGAGDLNGDGYADVAVGAPFYDGGGKTDEGLVRVFFGSSVGILSYNHVDLTGGVANALFGSCLTIFGDGDGDKIDDLGIGAPGFAMNGTDENGRVAIYGGDTNFPNVLHLYDGSAVGNQLGYSIAPAGDVNGDGYADLMVGEPFADDGANIDAGRVHIYLGGASPYTNTIDFAFSNPRMDQRFGIALTGLGDYDGAGRSIVAIRHLDPDSDIAPVSVYEYDEDNPLHPMQRRSGFEILYTNLDLQVVGVGDIDGDGSPEIGFGQPQESSAQGVIDIRGPIPVRAPLPPSARPRISTINDDPIALRGILDPGDDLRFRMKGWLPIGRTQLRLQWMIAPERMEYVKKGFGPWTPTTTHIDGLDLSADTNTPLSSSFRYRWRVRVRSTNPYVSWGPWMTRQPNTDTQYALRVVDTVTAVDSPVSRSDESLATAFPNPFNPRTQLEFELGAYRDVTLHLYDAAGRLVRTLHRGPLGAGVHRIPWDGRDDGGRAVASGVYLAVMRAGRDTSSLKLTLLK